MNVAGPNDRNEALEGYQEAATPVGHFLSTELESDCARFLADVRSLVERRAQEVARPAARL